MALRIMPWIVFGPITGICTGLALDALMRGQRLRAAAILCANVAILISIPILTTVLAIQSLGGAK